MDWAKIDAALAGALADGDDSDRYVVFVHRVPGAPTSVGATWEVVPGEGLVSTATLSESELDRLSEQAWVGRLGLSRPLGLADRI